MTMKIVDRVLIFLLASSFTPQPCARSEYVPDNSIIDVNEVFDLREAVDSEVFATGFDAKYYCIFRSLWSEERHPKDFPQQAGFSPSVLFSSTKEYVPFLQKRQANHAVETLAEHGSTGVFQQELQNAGDLVKGFTEGPPMKLNTKHLELNYQFLEPVAVNDDNPYLSAMAAIDPSPDWFTGFYLMDTRDPRFGRYWDRFRLQTYPWDAGTDNGDTYTAVDVEVDRAATVQRITVDTAPGDGIFVRRSSIDGENEILPVAEWECVLHECTAEDPECNKPDWPPANGCDILRYPECNRPCDPTTAIDCEQCVRESPSDPPELFFQDCCLAGRERKQGESCFGSRAVRTSLSLAAVVCAGLLLSML